LPRSVRSAKLKKSRDEAKAQRNHVNNKANSDGDTANGDDADKNSDDSSPNAKKELFLDKLNSNMVLEENLQCKFNSRSLKICYIANSENCFYKEQALSRAKSSHKKVSRRKQADFGQWHSKWLKSNVSDTSQTSIDEWFMGKCDGLVPNKTRKIVKNNMEITPYRTFFKFKAEILKTSSNGPALTSMTSGSGNNSTSGVLAERMNPGSDFNSDSATVKKES